MCVDKQNNVYLRQLLEETKEVKGHLGEYFKKLRNNQNYSFYLVFCFLSFSAI